MILARNEFSFAVAVALWLGAVAAGFAAWESYDATPGESATAAPTQQRGDAAPNWSLVMYAHPRCECTRASLAELREVLSRSPGALETRVVFVRPAGAPDGWERGELWEDAGQLSGAEVECDAGGVSARRAGATVSGHVVLRGPDGRVAFQGGITKARGRVGDNAGRRAILALLRGEPAEGRAPTFGCPLFGRQDCCQQEGESCQP
jgi:hypothetical protein